MRLSSGKKDDDLKIHVSSELKEHLAQLAKREDRKLGDYARHVLTRHVIVQSAINRWEEAEKPG